MPEERLQNEATKLLDDLRRAGDKRHLLQPRLHALLHDMEMHGLPVSATLRQLDQDLLDEAVEAQFDNMPV